jgi:hypothetical protein
MIHNWNDLLGEIVKLQYLTEIYKKTENEEIYLQIRAALKRVKKEFKHIHELAECGDDVSKTDFDTMMNKGKTL